MAIIEVHNLTFDYPGTRALDDVSFTLDRGTVTALVGPNGAGKTTLMNCLAAVDRPLSGTITIDGIPVFEEPRRSHRLIGYLPDFFGLYDALTVRQCLLYMARAQDLPEEQVGAAVERAARQVQLEQRLDDKAGELSRGLRQRLAIGQALIHDPPVLLFDEPASGLDPEARHHLSKLITDLCAAGKTLIVSSHILAELEDYSTHLMVIRDGRILDHHPLGGGAAPERELLLIRLTQAVPDLAGTLERFYGVTVVTVDGTQAEVEYSARPEDQHQLLKTMLDHNLPVCNLAAKRINLQEQYIARYGGRGHAT